MEDGRPVAEALACPQDLPIGGIIYEFRKQEITAVGYVLITALFARVEV